VSTITTNPPIAQKSIQASKPSFLGIVSGEIFKVKHMLSVWIMLILMFGAVCFPSLVTLAVPSQGTALKTTPLAFLYSSVSINLFVLRVFIGFFLLILTANVFGREYQLGTVRILLARGIGRLQLMFAKLLAVVIIALATFAVGLLLNVLLQFLQMGVLAGNFDALKVLDAEFWHNIGIYVLTVLISMGTTILLTLAMTSIGRSLAFGLSASLAFFPADNIGTVFMLLGNRLTHNDFWLNITAYFLGPNLNMMATAIVPTRFASYASSPLVKVDGTHTLLVALAYSAIFAAVAIFLTWKRDVKE